MRVLNSYVLVDVMPDPEHLVVTANPRERLIKAKVLKSPCDPDFEIEEGCYVTTFRDNVIEIDGQTFIDAETILAIVSPETEVG